MQTGGATARATPQQAVATRTASVSRGKTSAEIALERDVRNLNQITRDIVISNTVQGALVGAGAGCVLAELTDRKCRDGVIAGGIAGGIFGNQVGQQAAQAKRELVQADQTIARLRRVNGQLNEIDQQLRSVIRSQNAEIASLRRQLANDQVSASAVDARIASINNNRRAVITGLEASERNVAAERAELVRAEQQSGQSLTSTKNAVSSTEQRLESLRRSVSLVSS